MRILWICGLPREIQREVLGGREYGAYAEWAWVLGHLPPPEGIELHIACRTLPGTQPREFTYKGAHFHLVPVWARARVYCLFQFDWLSYRELFARVKPDLVHGWGTEDSFAVTAMKLAPKRHVVEVQGNLNTYLKTVPMSWNTNLAAYSERMVLKKARCVLAENQYSLDSALPMIQTQSRGVIEHPLRQGFLSAPLSPGEKNRILFLGTIDERKGIWDAIQAFRDGAPRDWTLTVVGNGAPEAVAKMHELVARDGLEQRFCHRPQVGPEEITSLMQECSIFLLPTRIDTGPTALKEALAMGLWPVCYSNSGPKHYISTLGVGSLAKDGDVQDLTAILRGTIVDRRWNSPAHRAKVEGVIRAQFSPKTVWKELVEVYQREISRAD